MLTSRTAPSPAAPPLAARCSPSTRQYAVGSVRTLIRCARQASTSAGTERLTFSSPMYSEAPAHSGAKISSSDASNVSGANSIARSPHV
ncbi:Uncharacterised protein [Burkholderia pseudomallei]|nr:Uncharacterised protein [Burkholderia pseudomallei]